MARNRTVNNGEIGEHLTDYAYKFAEYEFCLSKSGRAMKVGNIKYFVYIPDNINKKWSDTYILQIEKCNTYKRKLFRMIMWIIVTYKTTMSAYYECYWWVYNRSVCASLADNLSAYFLDKDFEKLTELFRKMEASELDRNYDLG